MQFELDDDTQAAADLAAQVFTDLATVEAVVGAEAAGGYDPRLWAALAETGVLGIALPDADGGAGLGLLGLVAVLEQQGRRVAPVPLWSAVATAALPLSRFGSTEQKALWLPGFLAGDHLLTGAFSGAADRLQVPTADSDGAGWSVSGVLLAVPAADRVAAILAPVSIDGRVAVAVIPTDRAGLSTVVEQTTDRAAAATVVLDGVPLTPGDLLGGDGTDVAGWIRVRAQVALAALQTGVCDEAVRMTAAYTSERLQFDRPLSTNQAVALRAADGYLDTLQIRLTTRRAAWLLDQDESGEGRVAAVVAAWWASEGGLRTVVATQHLHGGIGADVDYPIHRYFLWGRQLSFALGGAAATAAELGGLLETAPPIGAPPDPR